MKKKDLEALIYRLENTVGILLIRLLEKGSITNRQYQELLTAKCADYRDYGDKDTAPEKFRFNTDVCVVGPMMKPDGSYHTTMLRGDDPMVDVYRGMAKRED